MPDFGHKILNKLGLHDHHDKYDQQQQPPQQQQYYPPQQHHPRPNRHVHHDQRALSNGNGGTYPRLARLSDGSLLSSFTRFPGDGARVLVVARSTDGHKFEDIGEVTRGTGDTDNLFLLEVAPSVVLGAFRNHDHDSSGRVTHFRITVCRSHDGGRTWQFASQAAEKSGDDGLGIWEPFMRMGSGGEVQLTYSQEFAPNNQCTMLVTSTDQGRTWSEPRCLHGKDDHRRDGMNGIARTFDADLGKEVLVMVFETNTKGPMQIEALISDDDGESWGRRHVVYSPHDGHRHNAGAPQIASFADGSLAVVFMTDEDHDQVDWVKNASIKAVFAPPPRGGEIRWDQTSTSICADSSHWPGVFALDGHTLLATYECKGPKARAISLQ
ncbi:sialidase family protein [Aspergillus brunneoviolaceus CBS 621.78]|uniref:BNR/Asp-box repeat domain protein n=1 Tax=Aspergillus brunneoviolaceus CBS 621.78 TaxID=1450534 RepID=A0ACD1GBI7_9EURO|nr:BNR/Asp-box repeat domain protein [Aspergillus brunneoviolaceus CBS 621.78]RAH46577.1 BNR/Asp-box repeat domain protein [Aspergillus brunneoviolaceus CBS 621.78]